MSARILIVDDTPSSVKMAAAKLTNQYYEVLTADAGRVVLKAVEENAPAVTGHPDAAEDGSGCHRGPARIEGMKKPPSGGSTHF